MIGDKIIIFSYINNDSPDKHGCQDKHYSEIDRDLKKDKNEIKIISTLDI